MINLHQFVQLMVTGPKKWNQENPNLNWINIAPIIETHKQFWSAIPLNIFDERCMDIRPYAKRMAHTLFSSTKVEDINQLTILLKRLRRWKLHGRPASLLTRSEYHNLLRSQMGRCNSCGHVFSRADLEARGYQDEWNAEQQIQGLRPPHIDHIVPIFLGGNSADNLQILCSTCNIGKGAGTLWPIKSAILRPLKPSELFHPSTSLRWMSLERCPYCTLCRRSVKSITTNEELTIEKIDQHLGWLIENVHTVCTSCSQTTIFQTMEDDGLVSN